MTQQTPDQTEEQKPAGFQPYTPTPEQMEAHRRLMSSLKAEEGWGTASFIGLLAGGAVFALGWVLAQSDADMAKWAMVALGTAFIVMLISRAMIVGSGRD